MSDLNPEDLALVHSGERTYLLRRTGTPVPVVGQTSCRRCALRSGSPERATTDGWSGYLAKRYVSPALCLEDGVSLPAELRSGNICFRHAALNGAVSLPEYAPVIAIAEVAHA